MLFCVVCSVFCIILWLGIPSLAFLVMLHSVVWTHIFVLYKNVPGFSPCGRGPNTKDANVHSLLTGNDWFEKAKSSSQKQLLQPRLWEYPFCTYMMNRRELGCCSSPLQSFPPVFITFPFSVKYYFHFHSTSILNFNVNKCAPVQESFGFCLE